MCLVGVVGSQWLGGTVKSMRPSTPRKRLESDTEALTIIGQRIRAIRRAKTIAQDVLASRADIPRAHMTNIEAGRIDVRLSMLYRITRTLEISANDLLDFDLSVASLLEAYGIQSDQVD